ncbi:MAG: hypothetical protein HYZ53_07745 [Planctomycetes bacterium]|nr:hypothetical protein [Planctomycetota bacterium]
MRRLPAHRRPPALLVALSLVTLGLSSCSHNEPEPLFQRQDPGQLLHVKVYDAWRTAGQLKGTALVVFELPEKGAFRGKPEATVNGHALGGGSLSQRQASVKYYPVTIDGRLEAGPARIDFKWRGTAPDGALRSGEAAVILVYGLDLSFSIADCEVKETADKE